MSAERNISIFISFNIYVIYSYADSCRKNHNDTIIKTRETSLKIYTSHIICNVCVWQGVGDWTKTAIYWPSISVVSFSFSWCLTGGPGAQLSAECWLPLPHLVNNGSPNLLGVPRAPSVGYGFPYHFSSLTRLTPTRLTPTGLTSCPPSYIIVQSPTQSPTQSLEWHVWSS